MVNQWNNVLPIQPEPPTWASVSIETIKQDKDLRLEACLYASKAEIFKNKIRKNKYGFVELSKIVTECFYPNRFKRNYVSKKNGLPFFMPSQMQELNPKPYKYIAYKQIKNIENLIVRTNTLLITRSGTIGDVALVNKSLENGLFSDDIIRVVPRQLIDLGYIYAYFKSKIGNNIIQSINYGSVIQHIEPEHLLKLPIPNAPDNTKQEIHQLVIDSFALRDKSNELLQRAEEKLQNALKLPKIEDFERKDNQAYTFSINSEDLKDRLEANYYHPIVRDIEQHLKQHAASVIYLGDRQIVDSIFLPNRYKRCYVKPEFGVPFLGGKEILELDPRGEKYLSRSKHKNLIQELTLHENMLLITRSGTIGKVVLVPSHWQNWTASEHLLRVNPVSDDVAGYLFVWLNSQWALPLIQRHTYGSVIFEITEYHLADVAVPLVEQSIMAEINQLALSANKLRTDAFNKEQQALAMFEKILD